MVEFFFFLLLVFVLLFGLLSIQSYLTSKKKRVEVLIFSFLLFFVFFWGLALVLFGFTNDLIIARISAKYVWFFAPTIGFMFLSFATVFPKPVIKNKKLLSIILTILLVLSLYLSLLAIFTNSIVESISLDIKKMNYGRNYIYIAGMVGFDVFTAISLMLYQRYKSQGRDKVLARYLTIGLILTGILSISSNILLPNILGSSKYSVLGVIATLPGLISIGYSIVKYQLFDIRVLLGRVIYYALIGFLFYLAYFVVYFTDLVLFGSSINTMAILSGFINAILFAIMFVAFNNYLRKQVRSRIINPGYDPLEEQDQLSRKIAGQLSINDIANTTLETLGRTIRAKYQAVLVIPSETFKKAAKKMYLQELGDKREINIINLKTLHDLWEKTGKYPIIYDEIELEMPKRFRGMEVEIEKIMAWMQVKHLKVVVPVKESDENFAVLLIGEKEADSPYTNQDVDFLAGIASAIGLAITRALYYLEVEDLNKNLQKRVDEATKELSKKNKDLEEALDKLEEVRRQERDMIDVMGHELRTPITIVRNATLMVKSKLEKNAPKEDLLNYIEKAADGAKRELDLVETLLSATKVESNRIQMTLTKLDLNKVIEDAIFGHKHFADEKKLEIKYNKPKTNIFIYADKTRFQEVVDNLVSNAIKYTFEKGVEITVKKDTKAKKVQISVKDHGIGISKEDMKKLGRKFYRAKQHIPESLDKGAKEGKIVRPGGTGLGLYVVFNLMKIMNGKVDVESEVGKGSTFTVTIPEYDGQPDKQIDQTFES